MLRFVLVCVVLVMCACEQRTEESVRFSPVDILRMGITDGFERAESSRQFSFPTDHGPHPGFRNEWWYLTGNMVSAEGRRFGYQITFFNAALQPETEIQSTDSGWKSNRLWMAHAAITDVEGERHYAVERFSRDNPGLAGAQINPFKVWLEDWSLVSRNNEFPWSIEVKDEEFAFSLTISPQKNLVLQGVDGLSQKSPAAGNASYYYSFTRLATRGSIRLHDESFQVLGLSWLDREWSTSALAADQTGWDWFSLQFDDGQELMYYQLRDREGLAHSSSQGNWTDNLAKQTSINREDIQLGELESWISPSGIMYATVWQMQYANNSWIIRAVVEDQLMDVAVEYWEGAVDVINSETGEQVGRGYLEMVR